MAVPNTNTFSLQDVQTELGGVNDDLVECFANANAGSFDPAYEGSKNQLLNFRNYNAITYSSARSYTAKTSSGSSCSNGTIDTHIYWQGTGDRPAIGATVYTDAGTTIKNGDGKWYKMPDNTTGFMYSAQISATGEVLDIVNC